MIAYLSPSSLTLDDLFCVFICFVVITYSSFMLYTSKQQLNVSVFNAMYVCIDT